MPQSDNARVTQYELLNRTAQIEEEFMIGVGDLPGSDQKIRKEPGGNGD